MHTIARKILSFLPWLGIVLYGLGIYKFYSSKLNARLLYKNIEIGAAVEDVLGFGFWPPWLVAAAFIVILTATVYFSGAKKGWLLFAVGSTFLTLSIIDYCLYEVLAEQVLK